MPDRPETDNFGNDVTAQGTDVGLDMEGRK